MAENARITAGTEYRYLQSSNEHNGTVQLLQFIAQYIGWRKELRVKRFFEALLKAAGKGECGSRHEARRATARSWNEQDILCISDFVPISGPVGLRALGQHIIGFLRFVLVLTLECALEQNLFWVSVSVVVAGLR